MALAFRRAEERDLARLVEIHTSAFPDPRGHDARRRNFAHNAFGALDDLRVAVRDGTLVAHAFLFPLEVGFGGAKVPTGGIASVGVAPEVRGSGVASAFVRHLHEECARRGDAISLLYAFRQGFYAKLGYAAVTPSRRLRFSPAAVPDAWRRGVPMRAAGHKDLRGIVAIYDRALLRSTGCIARGTRFWEARWIDERRRWIVVGPKDGEVSGYVVWSVSQPEAHAKTTMIVHELVADDDCARRALFGAIAAQKDQVHEVELEIDLTDPIERALLDVDRARHGTEKVEHVLGELVGGPMVRLVDVPRALAARGYAKEGALRLDTDDGGYRLDVRGGRATAAPAGGEDGTPRLRVHGAALGALLFGALPARDAARIGWVEGDAAALEVADGLLALPPFLGLDPF